MPRPQRVAENRGARALRAWLADTPNMNQDKLSELLGVRQTTVSKWLGKTVPELSVALELERITKIPARHWTVKLGGAPPCPRTSRPKVIAYGPRS